MEALKLFHSNQIKQWDAATIQNSGMASDMLMEKAAKACFVWLKTRFPDQKTYTVVCGPGNNGGDGLAIARLLCADKKEVQVFLLQAPNAINSPDYLLNEQRLREQGKAVIHLLDSAQNFPLNLAQDILIDAIFGTGLSRPAEGLYANTIDKINTCGAYCVSIDMPSGLFSDSSSVACMSVVQSDITLSFQMPKLAFFFPENNPYVPEWTVLDIGLLPEFYAETKTDIFLLDKAFVSALLKPRPVFAHKGHFGHLLMMAGSRGKMGAAVLSAHAALRSGCGLLSVHVPGCGVQIVQQSAPEAMVVEDAGFDVLSQLPDLVPYSAIAAGPGIGTSSTCMALIKELLEAANARRIPLLLDADALNCMSSEPGLKDTLPPGSILTPHVKEFDRLAGACNTGFDRFHAQCAFSKHYGVYVLLKGRYSCLSCPDGSAYFNNTGNPGMAKGGSGDVLTGVIGSILAQSYSPFEAAAIGMYVHGLAGDAAALDMGQTAMKAGDIIAHMPEAFKRLEQN